MFSAQQYSGFDPRTIPGCELWLDAADSNTVQYASGSNISNWIDKSGNGRNFSNANAGTQPTLETSGLSGTASHVLFNTTNAGYLTNSTFSGFSNTTFDVYSVVRLGTTGGFTALFWGQPASLSMIIALGTGVNNGSNYAFHTSGTWRLAPTEGYNSSAFANIYQFYSTGTQIGRRYQGYDFNGLTNQVATFSFPGFSASEVTFFRPVSSSWSTTPLRVGEVILFNRVLTASERQQMEGYLGWKWGIQTRFTNTTSFSPTSITGCQLWLDAADSATFTPATPSNGALISQWNDKSGNARHVSNAATASQPRYRVGSNVTNGYPTVHFDSTSATGTNKGLLSNSTFTGLNTSNWNIFAAVSVQSDNSALLWDDQGGIDHITGCYTNGTALSNYLLHTSGVWRLAPTTGYVEPNVTRIIESYSTGSQVGRRVNGYFYGNVTDQSASYAFPTRTGNKTFYIANPSGGWSSGNLYVSELIIYNSVLSDANRSNVQNYLRAKWGITDGIIPTSHPLYYNPAAMRVFQPNDIAGLQLWFDGLDPNGNGTVPANNSALSTWVDKSGTGNSGTASGTTPLYQSGSGVLFSTGAYLTNYSASLTNESLFFVYTPTTSTASIVLAGPSANGGRTLLNNTNLRLESSSYFVAFGSLTPDGTVPLNQRCQSAYVITSGSSVVVHNGVTYSPVSLSFTGGLTTRIGAAGSTLTQFFKGTIHEVIAYNVALTTSQRQQIEGYLAAKWGLSASLPTTQPYYLQRALPSTPLFVPSTLSNLGLWLDGADSSTITLSAGTSNVTEWRDKSGNSRHATGLTSKWTTYPTGANYVQFTAANNSVLSCPGMNVVVNTQYTFFTVYRRDNPPTNPNHPNIQFFCGGSDGTTNARLHIGYESSTSMKYAQWANQYSVTVPALTSPEPINVWGFMQTSNQRIMYLNGTIPSGGTNANSSLVSAQNGGVIGAYQSDPFYSLDGRLYEFVIFTRALSTTERQQMEGYLAWKYGAQTNLPTTHPYYKFRP